MLPKPCVITVNGRRLSKNESFWVGACADRALNRISALIKKSHKIPSIFDHKNPPFTFIIISFQLKLSSSTALGA